MKTDTTPLQMLYLALNADVGVVVETNDRERYKQSLYRARATAKDEALSNLSIITSPTNPMHLWIARKDKMEKVA